MSRIELKRTSIEHARKTFTPSEVKVDDAGAVTVAFAQLNVVDRDGDLTLPGAFPSKTVPMSAYGHTSWMGELPTGKGAIREEGDWAIFEGRFFLDTEQGKNAHATVKSMAELQEWSYGYDPIDYAFEQRDGQQIRVLKTLDVFEVSPVLMGAGIGTHTRAIKTGSPGADLSYADHLALGLETVKAIGVRSKDRAQFRAQEKRGFTGKERERLGALASELEEATTNLRSLLEETDPEKGARLADAAFQVDALLEEARFLGVSI